MRRSIVALVICSSLIGSNIVHSCGDDDTRAIVNKAIQAAGGEAKLAKFQSAVRTAELTYMGISLTSEVWMNYPGQIKVTLVGAGAGIMIIDGDKGWTQSDTGPVDLSKEQFELEVLNLKADWIISLVPLKDKAFTLKAEEPAKVGELAADVVKVSRAGYPTVKLYFDKKTSLLVKSEFRAKSQEQKYKEVLAESYFSDFKRVDGATFAHKIALKHDGKRYLDTEVTELKAVVHDAKTYAKEKRASD